MGSRRLKLRMLPRKSWWAFSGHIVASYFAMWAFWEGTKMMNAAVASFLVRTEIIFILLFSVILLGEKLRRGEILAAVIIQAGAITISEGDPKKIFASLMNGQGQGVGFILLSAVAFGFTELFSKK
jgi:drug/metabolite transporter (DMT)-like permease